MAKRHSTTIRRASLGLVLSLVVLAQGTPSASEGASALAPNSLNFVYGDNVWIPGWTFNNSEEWLALNCTEQACQLVPAELRVTPASWQGHYDGAPTSGQRLEFRKSNDVPGTVVAWIRQNDDLPWLKPGQVGSYFAKGVTPVLQDKKNTYEIVIASSDETYERLAPVLLRSGGPEGERSPTHRGDSIYLRLRARDVQQLLSEEMVACFGDLHLDYLLWAGDLDGDGSTDYLIDYTDSVTGTVKFYLSSYANPGQLVDVAGVGVTHPLDGECA